MEKLRNMSRSNRVFYIFNALVWTIVLIIILYPLYLVIIASFSDPDAIVRGEVIWHPVGFSLEGYQAVFRYRQLGRAYINSLGYTALSVILSIVITLMGAYALSVADFFGKKVLNMYFVITMFFSGGLIPTFLTLKNIGLYNNPLILILMGCVSVWNLMVARTYIQNSIPKELYEAAELDGASHFQYFTKIIFPLSKTIIGVLAVYYGVAKWNDYFTGLVYIKDREWLPLQTVLREVLAVLQVTNNIEFMEAVDSMESINAAVRVANMAKYCIIVAATGPVIILYAFMQKYFQKGVMIGSLKG